MAQDISLDFEFQIPIGLVWHALTDPSALAQGPSFWWDGVITCEILNVNKLSQLSYTWITGGENTSLTWMLKEPNHGTPLLHLDQKGFQGEQAFNGALYGWQRMANQLEGILTQS